MKFIANDMMRLLKDKSPPKYYEVELVKLLHMCDDLSAYLIFEDGFKVLNLTIESMNNWYGSFLAFICEWDVNYDNDDVCI